MSYPIRLSEYEFYDPMTDQETVRMTATESRGTWYCDLPAAAPRGPKRREFKAAVQAHVMLGQRPGQIELEAAA